MTEQLWWLPRWDTQAACQVAEGARYEPATGVVRYQGRALKSGVEIYLARADAIAHALQHRAKRRASLKKQIAKIDKLDRALGEK